MEIMRCLFSRPNEDLGPRRHGIVHRDGYTDHERALFRVMWDDVRHPCKNQGSCAQNDVVDEVGL